MDKPKEQIEWEEGLLEQRIHEQQQNSDYDFSDGEPQKCECGRFINSHGHCPRCDY